MGIRKIMIVDDCDLAQMIARLEIEQYDAGIETIGAFDGQEALEMLCRLPRPPDLILLDINMPRMNGHEFLAAYQAGFAEHARVAMLSSSDLDEDRRSAMAYPFVQDYLPKPFTRAHLELVAIEFAQRHAPVRQAQGPAINPSW